MSLQKNSTKECSVSVNKTLVDDRLKETPADVKIKKKCVVFLDKDSIIDIDVINKVRCQSIPQERHSIIKNKHSFSKSTSVEPTTPMRLTTPIHSILTPLPEVSTPILEPALSSELKKAIDEKNLFTTKTKSKFMSALGELEEANEEENRKRYKQRAINEVIISEQVYIKQLETIINFFEKPLRERCLLTKTDLEMAFGGLASIYKLNKELLDMLEKDRKQMGAAFLKIAPFFKLYSTYAYDFKNILEIMERNKDNNEEFSKFLQNQESRPEVKTKLSALLITPIQRVPRYCLLLMQILEHSKETEEDYNDIKASLKEVEKSAKHIDTLVEQKENSIRLVEIQTALVDNKPTIIKPGRSLVHEGSVLKILPSSVIPIHLILMNDIILFCKTKKKTTRVKNSLKCETIYPLSRCRIVEKNLSRNIHISCENESVLIYVEKAKEFHTWLRVLKETLTKAVNNRLTLRKESSLRKPAHYKDLSQYNEVDISPYVAQTKRRLNETMLPNITPRTNLFHNTEQDVLESPSKKFCSEKKDSLFPLRTHLLPRKRIEHPRLSTRTEQRLDMEAPQNVYVFGEPTNVNRGFNFSLVNFFSSIGNSLKRLFRYKQN